jgi:hypothetical protein
MTVETYLLPFVGYFRSSVSTSPPPVIAHGATIITKRTKKISALCMGSPGKRNRLITNGKGLSVTNVDYRKRHSNLFTLQVPNWISTGNRFLAKWTTGCSRISADPDLISAPFVPSIGRPGSLDHPVPNCTRLDTCFPQAKRAARQQGDPSSMGGSSNGGKAIGTLWCKSMFGSGCCQECFPRNIKLICINYLGVLYPIP